MNITHLSQKLGLVVLAGFAVGTLSSCIGGEVPFPKSQRKMQDYNYILWVERSGKWQEVKELSKFTFYVGEPIVYTAILAEKQDRDINSPYDYTVLTDESRTFNKYFNEDLSITRKHNLEITYKRVGKYKQRHFIRHYDGQISNDRYITINVIEEK